MTISWTRALCCAAWKTAGSCATQGRRGFLFWPLTLEKHSVIWPLATGGDSRNSSVNLTRRQTNNANPLVDLVLHKERMRRCRKRRREKLSANGSFTIFSFFHFFLSFFLGSQSARHQPIWNRFHKSSPLLRSTKDEKIFIRFVVISFLSIRRPSLSASFKDLSNDWRR